MIRAERETQILVNRADMDDGYFLFYTTEAGDYRRLCKRIGGEEKLLNVRRSKCDGQIVSWDCEVPIQFWNRVNFGVGKRKTTQLSEQQRQQRAEQLRIARKVQISDRNSGRAGVK